VPAANAALPTLTTFLDSVQEAVRRRQASDDVRGGDPALVLRGAAALLEVDGIVLRDLARGLIDFEASTPSGKRYLLCWIVGEPDVGWWHWPEDGYAGRVPVERLPS
jgi:hypothetical protein